MDLKPALDVDQQIALLSKRGLLIDDVALAREFLLENSYYHLNIYFHNFMVKDKPDCFTTETSLTQIIEIYYSDRWFRHQLLQLLEPVEVHLKTAVAYYLGREYGSDCFLKPIAGDLIRQQSIQNTFLKDIEYRSQDPIIIHHQTKYEGKFPIWVVMEFLTFNQISRFYSCLKNKDKKTIAIEYFKVNEYYLESWVHSASVLRNICAHYGYLFRRKFTPRPALDQELKFQKFDPTSLFCLCQVISKLSKVEDYQKFISQFRMKLDETPTFKLKDYGFPPTWLDNLPT
jgi:abortive infection bacteriophage resistance protein